MHEVVVPGRTRRPATGDSEAGGVQPATSPGLRRGPRSRPAHRRSRLVGIYNERPDMARGIPGSSESRNRASGRSRCGLLCESKQLRLQFGRGTGEDRMARNNHVVISGRHLCSDPAEGFAHQSAGSVAMNGVAELLGCCHAETSRPGFCRYREEHAMPPNSLVSRHIRILESCPFPYPKTGRVTFPFHNDRRCGRSRPEPGACDPWLAGGE